MYKSLVHRAHLVHLAAFSIEKHNIGALFALVNRRISARVHWCMGARVHLVHLCIGAQTCATGAMVDWCIDAR